MQEMSTSDAQKRATSKYDANNTVQFTIKLNKNTDSNLIEKLNSVDNRQGYIKELIRKDIDSDIFINDEHDVKQACNIDGTELERHQKYNQKMLDRFGFLARRLLAINEITIIMMNPDDSDLSAMRRYIQKKHECFSNLYDVLCEERGLQQIINDNSTRLERY